MKLRDRLILFIVVLLISVVALIQLFAFKPSPREHRLFWDLSKFSLGDLKTRLECSVSEIDFPDAVVHIQKSVCSARAVMHPDFPKSYFSGALFGISAWNPGNVEMPVSKNDFENSLLLKRIKQLSPPPDGIYPLTVRSVEGETQRGYAILFNTPSSRIEQQVIGLGREFVQPAVLKWWAHSWGANPDKHSTMMQSILPAAGALRELLDESPAWRVR